MGFWSSVGSFFSSVGSAIGSCISSVCSAIGGAIASGIGKLATAISPYVGMVANVVMAVAQILGIFKPEEKVKDMEDLGYAMQEAEQKPEDFDSINEYIDYLREQIRSGKVDVSKSRSPIESAGYLAMGTALTIKGIDEKFDMKTDAEFWSSLAMKFEENKLNEKELHGFLEGASKKELDAVDVSHYLNMQPLENGTSKSDISSMMLDTIKEKNPHLHEKEVYERFNDMVSPVELKVDEKYWNKIAEESKDAAKNENHDEE